MAATIEINHPDQTPPLIAIEHDLDQGARHAKRLRRDLEIGLGKHTLERPELLTVVERIYKDLLYQFVQLSIRRRQHHDIVDLRRGPDERCAQTTSFRGLLRSLAAE